MTFVNAIPLALLIALPLLPLLLHLLTLQRLRTVELSTYRFLFDSYVQQRRRTQFLEVLLVLLRVLFVLGLLALIARPTMKKASGLFQTGSGRDVILLVDCSASMDTKTKGQAAFDRAKEAAKSVVANLSSDDRVTLIRVTARPEEVFRRFSTEAADLQDRIDQLKTSPARANLFAALNSIFGAERKPPVNPVVYFFTDAQANSFREIERQQQNAERCLPPKTPFLFVDVGTSERRSNLAVVGNAPPRPRTIAGLPIELQAKVVNYSNEPSDAILVFSINDKEVERQRLKLKPNETVTRKLAPYIPTQAGVVRGQFAVTASKGSEAFSADNRYLFALHVEPKLKVLVINGAPNADAFENETLYLRAALRAEHPNEKEETLRLLDPTREIAQSLEVVEEVETIWAGLDDAQLKAKLDEYAAVILANAGALHQATTAAYPALRSYVQDGGGLIICPGDQVLPNIYNTNFIPTAPPVKDQLTPVRFGAEPSGDLDTPETFRKLARIDYDHPIFSIFNPNTNPDTRYFDRVFIKKHWPLKVPETKNLAVLAEYADRTPAIVESRFGDGKVLLLTFPINARWTNLPLNGVEFVPFMLQAVNYVQRRADAEGPQVVAADEPATFSVASHWAPARGVVTDPSGRKQELTFERFGGRLEAVFEHTTEQGVYSAEVGTTGGNRSTALMLAVNMAVEESDPTRFTADQLRDLFPATNVTFVDQSAEAKQDSRLDKTNELWRAVIYVLFALIGFELCLATLVGGGGKKGEG